MANYKTYVKNLQAFYDNLQETQIKFMFFLASDLSQPKLKDTFKYIPSQDSYITPGMQSNGWHIYRKSSLKYLVTSQVLERTNPVPIYNVTLAKGTPADVNHGDHLTFTINRNRQQDTIVKAHKTEYADHMGNFTYNRYSQECNFTFDPVSVRNNLRTIACERIDGSKMSSTIDTVHRKQDVAMIEKLCSAMLGNINGGASRIIYKGKHRVVHTGKRGGKYVLYKKNRVYLQDSVQKGGAIPKSYNGITIFSDTFVTFLSGTLFENVKQLKDTLDAVSVIYDEMDELGVPKANDYVTILYDFNDMEDRNIFYLKTDMALAACYAFDVVAKDPVDGLSKLTQNELQCYREFQMMCGPMMQTQLNVVVT